MTIEKAIELNEDTLKSLRELSLFNRVIALQLGIEALRWIDSRRDGDWHRCNILLPGETEEPHET